MKKPPVEKIKSQPSGKWRKKYECKKGKGKHDWAVLSLNNRLSYQRKTERGTLHGSYKPYNLPSYPVPPCHETYPSSIVQWRCRACNKHEIEHLSSDPDKSLLWYRGNTGKKKLDPYRQNFI